MKSHVNAQKLIDWLRHRVPSTTAQMSAAGIMSSRDISEAIVYGTRQGVFDAIKQPGASPRDRVLYRWTGRQLPVIKNLAAPPSFDALLAAWGIRFPAELGWTGTRWGLSE